METADKKYKISILGCGWYGFELAAQLSKSGHYVHGSTTSKSKLPMLEEVNVKPYLLTIDGGTAPAFADFFDCEILVITLPPKKASSTVHNFISRIEMIAKLSLKHKIPHLIFISSTAVYRENNQDIDELTLPDPGTESGKMIYAAEEFLKKHNQFTTTIIRFGGLIGPGRDPGRFFAGKKNIPNGKAPINLIHLRDCIGITIRIIENQAFNCTINACHPHHPEKQFFYLNASINSGFDAPEFIDELLDWKVVSSVIVSEQLKYTWEIANWNTWLELRNN